MPVIPDRYILSRTLLDAFGPHLSLREVAAWENTCRSQSVSSERYVACDALLMRPTKKKSRKKVQQELLHLSFGILHTERIPQSACVPPALYPRRLTIALRNLRRSQQLMKLASFPLHPPRVPAHMHVARHKELLRRLCNPVRGRQRLGGLRAWLPRHPVAHAIRPPSRKLVLTNLGVIAPMGKVVASEDARGLELGPERDDVGARVPIVVRGVDEREIERPVRNVRSHRIAVSSERDDHIGPRLGDLVYLA